MIARDNLTRERLSRAARAKLKRDGPLSADGVFIAGREYAPGDRVIARRNSRRHDVDNGTLATIISVDRPNGEILIATDRGDARSLDHDYAAEHLQHAYALTGHGAQCSTFAWVGAIGRPEEFTQEWAYTALSRAKHQTTIHIVGDRSQRERERDEYAPAQPDRTADETRDATRRAIRRSETERLATQQLPEPREPQAQAAKVPDHAVRLDGASMLRRSRTNSPCAIRR
jgi:ATP-dependent exoDNAse (exonuclease V) alpha subunit